MRDLTNEIKEKAEKMGCEFKEFAGEMSNEMRGLREVIKVKSEKISNEIKNRMMR